MKKDKIEIHSTQGQGSALVWKGTSYKKAFEELYSAIGSGSISVYINGIFLAGKK